MSQERVPYDIPPAAGMYIGDIVSIFGTDQLSIRAGSQKLL